MGQLSPPPEGQRSMFSYQTLTKRTCFLIGILLFLLCTGRSQAGPSAPMVVHFLDVGYGDAILLRLPEGAAMLIDGGGPENGSKVATALRQTRIRQLDFIVITHFHNDHAGGLNSIFKEFVSSETRIFIPLLPGLVEPDVEAVIAEIKHHPYRIVRRGETITISPSIRLEVLHPKDLTGNANEDSLVIRVIHEEVTLLMAGDVGIMTQKELAEEYGAHLKTDLIKIPHHAGEVVEAFVKAVDAQDAILTIGPNPYGSPNPETMEMYRKAGAMIHRTDVNRTITVISNGRSYKIEKEYSP